MKAAFAAIAVFSGMALASQVGMNNALRGRMQHPILAALTSFAIGTTVLAVYVATMRPGMPSRDALFHGPWWMWCGGLVGAFYVAASSVYASRLGGAAWFGLIVTGQVAASLIMDHYGLFGFSKRPINVVRLGGATLLLIGVALVLWGGVERRYGPAKEPDGESERSASARISPGSRG